MLIFNRNKLKEEIAEMKAKKYQLIADNGKTKQMHDDLRHKVHFADCDEESEDDNGED